MADNKNREVILDLARLLGCISVMLFHFYSLHLSGLKQYPYGDSYNYFSYGYLGVQFFFILSGFFESFDWIFPIILIIFSILYGCLSYNFIEKPIIQKLKI